MAGGKQSPRDKMIGMMYLVLTALLALQVSNAVLEKFVFIDGTLTQLVGETAKKNVGTIQSIETEFVKKGKPGKDKPLYDGAMTLRESTVELIAKMDSLKEKMVKITGGREEGKIVGGKDYDKVSTLMLQQPDGKQFEADLDAYVDNLNNVSKTLGLGLEEFKQLTKDGSEIDLFKNDPDQNVKDFLTVTFESTPTAAGMASVSQLQSEVLEYEGKLLAAIAGKIGAEIITINTIVPMVRAESNIVTVGGTYSADLFIAASNSNADPLMTVDGKEIAVEPDANNMKMGKISIPARSVGEHSFVAKIAMNDTTFTQTIKYTVTAPTVTFSSSTLKALYENCANGLTIQCPNCGNSYDPGITASNAKVLKGKGVGMVEIVPTSRKAVTISVSNSGVPIGKETFQVKRIPEPKIQILAGGQRADNRDFVPLSVANRIVVQAVPDENFRAEVPRDADYRVMSGRVIHSAGTQAFSSPNITINGLRPGPVSIQIDGVVRRRYDGSTEKVTLDSKFRSFNVR